MTCHALSLPLHSLSPGLTSTEPPGSIPNRARSMAHGGCSSCARSMAAAADALFPSSLRSSRRRPRLHERSPPHGPWLPRSKLPVRRPCPAPAPARANADEALAAGRGALRGRSREHPARAMTQRQALGARRRRRARCVLSPPLSSLYLILSVRSLSLFLCEPQTDGEAAIRGGGRT